MNEPANIVSTGGLWCEVCWKSSSFVFTRLVNRKQLPCYHDSGPYIINFFYEF
jgi:hypothetical protein